MLRVAVCAGLALYPSEIASSVDNDRHVFTSELDVYYVVQGLECKPGGKWNPSCRLLGMREIRFDSGLEGSDSSLVRENELLMVAEGCKCGGDFVLQF